MHNREKHPEIWVAKERAEKKLAPLLSKRKKYTDEIQELQIQLEPLLKQKRELNDLAMQDHVEIAKLRTEISTFAKAMGAVVLGSK